MSSLKEELAWRLDETRKQGLLRELRMLEGPQKTEIQWGGRTYLNFSSNDYLGLANHPRLVEAGQQALKQYGAGSGSSRLICGSMRLHEALENDLARFKGTEAGLTFSSGYAAALAAICSVVGVGDVLVTDQFIHASLIDAARLCRAQTQVFRHNDLNHLDEILRGLTLGLSPLTGRRSRVLIVTESIFSMDGDRAPLGQIVELKEKYGAWLMVDEAHATGLYGSRGSGLVEALGLSERVEIQMGTLSKALGSSGGFLCGSRELRDYLVNHARSFIFTTAPNPASLAAAQAAVEWVQTGEGATARQQLEAHIYDIQRVLPDQKLPGTAILPLIVGDETKAMGLSGQLRDRGIFIPAIRYPSVARGAARLRLTLSSAHTVRQIQRLIVALRDLGLQISPATA